MFEVIAKVTFHGDDGREVKEPKIYNWTNLEKVSVVEDLEDSMVRALTKLNNISKEMVRGRAPIPTTTNPLELRLEMVVLEDGVKWTRAIFEWPNMGEEQQGMLIGIFDGELANMSKHVKDRFKQIKKPQAKAKG